MCKRISLQYAIQIGVFDQSYEKYFKNHGKDPNSISLAIIYSTEQQRHLIQDPINDIYKHIPDNIYYKLICPSKKKFPGRRTK